MAQNKMKNLIELKLNDWADDYNILYNMMNNEDGIKEIFASRLDRINAARISWFIKMDGKYVGFISLVCEKANYDYLFLDIGVIKEYRKCGIGKQALEEVKKKVEEMCLSEYVLIETKKSNYGANKAAEDIGCYLTEFGDRNVYLLQKERCQEFIDENHMEKLADHYSEGNDKRSLLKDFYK